MISIKTKLKQYCFLTLPLSVLVSTFVLAISTPPLDCNSRQCTRFKNLGFSSEIAGYGETISKVMKITNIETFYPSAQSFMEAMRSNWGPHTSGQEYSEHHLTLLDLMRKMGMYTVHNELLELSTKPHRKILVIVLGGHPAQLCSTLVSLIPYKGLIDATILIGSTNSIYDRKDYSSCTALNSSQILSLNALDDQSSDKEVMDIYFKDPSFRTITPIIINSGRDTTEASFNNNQLFLTFLYNNRSVIHSYQNIILAVPQPYMPEAFSILRHFTVRDSQIYRLSAITDFDIFESLNALRNWLLTDHSMENL